MHTFKLTLSGPSQPFHNRHTPHSHLDTYPSVLDHQKRRHNDDEPHWHDRSFQRDAGYHFRTRAALHRVFPAVHRREQLPMGQQ